MSSEEEPRVLELASLPREQVGPFLLLGLDKDASAEQVEAHWAQRVLWARKGRIRIPLEDVNWAREVLRDTGQRGLYEAASLNVVLSDGFLHRLAEGFGLEGRRGSANGPRWQPLSPPPEPASVREGGIPDPAEIAASIVLPEVVEDFPFVTEYLKQAVEEPIDPWAL